MKYSQLQGKKPIVIVTPSLNPYPHIKAQTSEEIQPLENYENSTVVFDMLPSKKESNFDFFLTRGRHSKIDIYFITHSCFHLPKKTILNNSSIIILYKQTLMDVVLTFHDIAELDMNLQE